ncbi:P-loop containing nucleoside triphosphate hydrolase protein [Hypoxylon trugodes]|uniref:P-loop containing nucleoside triphosphate hydrolase protein n=1 Tax=Hypoxylon trugodes TaxID=326681 RepID=UPI002190717C|nr:P-loop containing nucleoside triphosphate hydrolase protein [Hypoxylon trugodes]KAI1386313.1 P-loop containing nucleoside triphosphate hydrolase protein [Hypoxylon trugodes]
MGSLARSSASTEHSNSGNLSILTKVDKLRELIGTKVALPQLVVVGDQSSGKSSVLEGLTGFAFPRDAELCTRYATQITCRRENEESIDVSIIPYPDAAPIEQERVRKFHRTLKEMAPESLAQVFKEANEAMGIRTSAKSKSPELSTLPTFSEHILKIEKLGPNEQHFTVIDVPGIFRKKTEGVTTDADIELVRAMVKKYMKDTRTIILAIMPSNVDPATQEILNLAKEADASMQRTMAVLTKPDLAIERTTQQIAIDHVTGTRSDLDLGYYIVKNRGPDDGDMTLEQGKEAERRFFAQAPWSILKSTGRAGIDNLSKRVRDLLVDLIKREFPKLKAEVAKEVVWLRNRLDGMGAARNNEHTQRAYLNKISEAFQTIARDALNAYYTGNRIFDERHDLRLITRVVEANEKYSNDMFKCGHTRPFLSNLEGDTEDRDVAAEPEDLNISEFDSDNDDELEGLFDIPEITAPESRKEGIMEYIEKVYRASRGQELGTFGGALLSTMFKEQSKKWEPITLSYMKDVILAIHHFISEIVVEICPDTRVRDELWNGYLLEELQASYRKAMDHVRLLLDIEREGIPLTLNHYFSDNLQKSQSSRLVETMTKLGEERELASTDGEGNVLKQESGIFLSRAKLNNLSFNMANSDHVREYMHDVLKSYYKVSRKRFVDVVCQQAVNYFLLQGEHSPLKIFSTQMVLNLNEDQLEMIAAEDAPVKAQRERLGNDKKNFEKALKVLKGSA